METLPVTNNNSKQSNTNRDALSVLPATLSSDLSLFNKRIEFHLARKPFTGFSNGGGGNFQLETLNPTHPNPHHKHADLKPAKAGAGGSEVSENALDAELRFGIITFRRIGAGLENLGNTCFLNSVLQCLTYTEPLAAYLQSGKHQTSCRTAGFCALCAIQKHVSRALQSTGRILAPKEIVSNLRCISRSFRNSRQEDAHEYMVNLLESMHKCCLPSGVPSESSSAYDKSLVHKIFGGRLRSQVKCMQCSFFSDKFDPFLDLSLEINKAESLYKALGHFTAEEQLDGGGRHYHCQKCKQKVKALKQLKIHKAPYVLAIHLKRFGSHLGGQKIDKKIQFGPTLDLKPFVTDPNEGDFKYTLYGVLVHAGWSTHSGHYYCFIRTSSGMWYSLDDNRVVQVSEKRVLEQKAYMLFYHRDRRNVASKKSLDVQKANMTANADGRNKAYSNSNQGLKETVQSGQIQTSANNTPNRTCNGLPTAERSAPNNAPIMEVSSGVSPVKDSVKGVCIKSQEGRESLPHQDPLDKGSNVPLKHDTAIIASTDAKLVQVAIQPSHDSILKSVSSKDVTDSITEKASSGMGTANAISAELSSLPNAKDISVQKNVYEGKASQRLKKKLPKCPIMKTRLSSKILGTSLSVRKKKHKRSKKCTSGSRKLLQKRLVDGVGIPSDLGPSTSERFKTTPEKGCMVNNMVSNSNGLLVGVTDKEFGERSGQIGAVLAADDRSQETSKADDRSQETSNTGSEGNQLNGRKDDLMKNDLMSMGTRGLEETIVPRWDEIVESYPSQMTEPSGVKNVSIGYIGDEWDDEYDRGKRRKVRTLKNDYGGPNPFQEVATLNANLKKAKLDQAMNPKFKKPRLDQSSSGNKPYRL